MFIYQFVRTQIASGESRITFIGIDVRLTTLILAAVQHSRTSPMKWHALCSFSNGQNRLPRVFITNIIYIFLCFFIHFVKTTLRKISGTNSLTCLKMTCPPDKPGFSGKLTLLLPIFRSMTQICKIQGD